MKENWNDYEILAYAIIVRNCALSYYTLAHELGHIMGARHDWYEDSTNLSPYSYNHGYVAIGQQPQLHAFQTIMAYDDECADRSISLDRCPRILYWSNPATTYPPGDPNAVSLGVGPPGPERADNHLTLNTTASTVANFRCSSRGIDNVWMKDTWDDTGDEPDPRTAGEDMWKSPYIWVRRSEDVSLLHQHQHEDPVIGVPNWIYVKLQNGGTATNGDLEIYGSNTSPSLVWPSDWTRLGTVPVSSLAKNSVRVVPLQWTPSTGGHYCLLARWVSATDAMAFPETADIQGNVRNNNNLVWRNLSVVDFAQPASATQTFDVRNTGGANARVRLVVRSSDAAGQSYLRQGAVTLSLDEPLLRAWREGGTSNQGLRVEGRPPAGDRRRRCPRPCDAAARPQRPCLGEIREALRRAHKQLRGGFRPARPSSLGRRDSASRRWRQLRDPDRPGGRSALAGSSRARARSSRWRPRGLARAAKVNGELLDSVEPDQLLDEAVLKRNGRERPEASRSSQEAKRLSQMAGVEPDVAVGIFLSVLPQRAREDRRQDAQERGLADPSLTGGRPDGGVA